MKKIKLPISNTVTFSFKLSDLKIDLTKGKQLVKIGSMKSDPKDPDLLLARENGADIIWSTISLENKIGDLLVHTLFEIKIGVDKKRDFFKREILDQSVLSFNYKRQLVLELIKNFSLLTGKERNKLQTQLKKVIEFRNAFAHGDLLIDMKDGPVLEYNSSEKKRDILNDQYWSKVENTFTTAHELIKKASDNNFQNSMKELKRDELVNEN